MHLQNKHLDELTAIEAQATPKTCKTKLPKDVVLSGEEFTREESIREYYSVGSANEVVNMESDDEAVYMDDMSVLSKIPVIKSIIRLDPGIIGFLAVGA